MLEAMIGLILVVTPSSVTGDDSDLPAVIQQCSEIQGANERLVCFDELAFRVREGSAERSSGGAVTSYGEWTLTREVSPIDDSELVYLSLLAGTVAPDGPRQTLPTLFIRCKEGRLESFINWGVPVGSGTVKVTTRLDDEKAEMANWIVSTDYTGTFVRGSHPAFVARLRKHDRFVARLIPLSRSEMTATFNLGGLSEVIEEVYRACTKGG